MSHLPNRSLTDDAPGVKGTLAPSAPPVTSSTSVEFVGVTKRFGGIVALQDLNLSVVPGEFLAILGPSGCGKTTMLRLIAGLEHPDSGEIRIGGRTMAGVDPWKRQVPMVWQDYALLPFLDVSSNVEFALKTLRLSKAERRRRTAAILEQLGIAALANRRIDQLSGGQKQRVAIARALVQKPGILLLDEPLSALDPHLRVRMQSDLRQMHKDLGITFFYITHYQSEALSMADRIVVMNHGEVAQIGTPEEIYRRPRNRFVAEFVGANTVLTGTVREVVDEMLVVESPLGSLRVPVAHGHQTSPGSPAGIAVGADVAYLGSGRYPNEQEIQGALRGQEFIGGTVAHYIELQDGTMFRVDVASTDVRGTPNLGDRITVSWPVSGCVLLRD